jgi:ribosomal protein S18 acetylase RimI-like enzyme
MPLVVEPGWIGRRIVIRYAIDRDESGRLLFADVVGDLLELTTDMAIVDASTGPVHVPLSHAAVAKLVEPSAAEILALSAVSSRGWRAAETAEVGGWLLRANHGVTSRANSALPLRRPANSLSDTLDVAQEWYATRGLPLRVQTPLHARRLLDAELAERGWPSSHETLVLALRIPSAAPDAPDVRIRPEPDDAWVDRFRDGTTPPGMRALLTRHERVGFAEIRRDGVPLAIGRGAIDDEWLGITAVEVAPEQRRQGLATAIIHALWRWGADVHAAKRSYLEVEVHNDPAITLYRALGYWEHHVYRYRTGPSSRE